jgi:nucleoside-diphosphate-sugar epimerase
MSNRGIHLVTGGSGYLGSLIVQALVQQGARVRVLDLVDAPDRPANVEFVPADLRSPHAVRVACRDVSVVFHAAAQVPLAKDRELFWSVNCDGSRNLMEACLTAGVQKIVHISSSAVYGIPRENPVTELSERKPVEQYGKSKLAAEEICHNYIQRGLDITTIRPRTIIGPGRLGLMQIIFEWVSQNRNVPVLGKGDNVFQFVHAADVTSACLKAAQRPGSREYNIGAQEFGTMREMLEALIEHACSESRIVCLNQPLTERAMHVTSTLGISPLASYHAFMYGRSLYFDTSRAKTELNWTSQYSNVEMFCEAYDWYMANRSDLKSGGSIHRSKVAAGIMPVVSRVLDCLPAQPGAFSR